MKHRRSLIAVLTMVMLLMPALSLRASQANAQDGERQTLRFGVNAQDLATLDPHLASGTQDRTVVDMVFNGLVRYKPGDASVIEPDLATTVPEPVDEAGTQSWTFTLRDDAMCHPTANSEAYPLTSADVVFSLQKAANAETSGSAGEYTGMTFEAVDPTTVKVTVDTPLSPTLFLPKFTNYQGGYIVCQQAYEALGADAFKTNPVGTGPFMFSAYTPQTSLELVANDDYFRGAPKLAGVEIRYMPDTTSRELALQSGEIDAGAGLAEAAWVDRINTEGNLVAEIFGVGESVFLNLDITNEYLKDPLVRQAITLAISREEHQALYGSPVAEITYSVVPEQLVPGGLTREEVEAAGLPIDQDIEQAKALLTEAGYPDGFSLSLVTSEMAAYRSNYEVLQAELSEIGIEIELSVVDHATMHSQIREGVNPIVIYSAYRPTADSYLNRFFASDSIIMTGAKPDANFSHYTGIDDLIAQARAELDPAAQIPIWKEANLQILKDFVAVPLHYQNQVYARSQGVDYGHELVSVLALYPGIDETTTVTR